MARNKQVGPEMKLYQIDTMIYLTAKNIVTKITMFSKFLELGGVCIANKLGLNRARAIERFDKNYKVDDIQNLTTIDGQANETWLRKSGFLVSIDGKYELSPIAKAIDENEISLAEYCFLILSKQWVVIKKPAEECEYKANLLSLILEIISSTESIPVNDFVTIINQTILHRFLEEYDGLSLSNQEAARFIAEPLLLSGLIYEVDGSYKLSGKHKDLVNDYILHSGEIRRPNEVGAIEESFLNCFEYGMFDIVNGDNKHIYIKSYPGLFKFENKSCSDSIKPLQQIFYGAPGTGKSHKIKSEVDEKNKICYRATFHPDSDYSTFVGAYKPSMEKAEEHLYNKEELISKLTELKEQGVTYSPQKFGAKYWYSLKGLSLQEKKDILTACDMSDNYTVEFDKGIAVGEELLKKAKESRIIYGFIPQAFAKAYVHAWNTKDEVYLVIEEINRGNCAQIFGDLFQLLDRKDGFSEYPIDADADLESHIKEKLEKSTRDDIPELVKAGKKLMLPSNLYIWATMNTSDQSLFPIDSAFKRRWDWVYTPIKQHDEESKIVVGEDAEYDWWGFLEKINQVIDDATSSEDKKLGYFFVKAQDKKVSAEKFVGKVLFYLWNDVFKNYGFDSPIFSKGGNKKFAFSDFFTKSGEPEPEMVKAFLDRLDETIDKENSFKIKNKSTGNSAETAE